MIITNLEETVDPADSAAGVKSKHWIDAKRKATAVDSIDEEIGPLVEEIIGRVADKWTMLILGVLDTYGTLRFSQIANHIPSISQKVLTKVLRGMERDGLVIRTIYPVIPPKVEYYLTNSGQTLGAAFCGVWTWAAEHREQIKTSRADFDGKAAV